MQWDDQKCIVFKIEKRMVKNNQDIIGEQCIKNYDGVLTVGEQEKKEPGKVIMRIF